MREEVIKLFRELREIMDKFSTLLIVLIAVNNTAGAGANPLFRSQHNKLMMFLVLIIVVYYLTLVVRTVLVLLPPQNARFLPILTFIIIALLGGSASVLALVII